VEDVEAAGPHLCDKPLQFRINGVESIVLEQLKRRSEFGSGGEGKPAVTARGEM